MCSDSMDIKQFYKELHGERGTNRKWYQVQEIHQAETCQRPAQSMAHVYALVLPFTRHLLPATAKDRMLNYILV